MNKFPNNEQNIHTENSTVEIQNNIQGSSNTVNIHYPVSKEPELEDFNFPKPIDSFKGREDEFKQLDDYLFLDEKKMVVIWGLPGFGKTELLKQFAQKSKLNSKIKYICWIQASNKDTLMHSLKNLVKILKLPEVDDLRVLLQTVRNRYHDSETLFVFDDVDSPRSLLDWETPSSCWTLVSSQLGEWGIMPCVELGPLAREAGVAVLQHLQDQTLTNDPTLWRTLAALLDNAPLALQLAAAYIRQDMKLFPKKFNLLKYINKLRKSLEKFVDEQLPAHTFLPYQHSIQVAMKFSIEKIKNLNKFESNLALDILNIIPYLNLNNIRENTLLKFSLIQNKLNEEEDEEEDEDEEDEEHEEKVRRALYVLQSYSFVRLEDSYIRIHGLVQHTLIFYHNKSNENMESYYTSCLEYVLNNHLNGHSLTILNQADKKLEIFEKFYDKYKSKIIYYEYKANSTSNMAASDNSNNFKNLIETFAEVREYYKSGDDNLKNKTTIEEGSINEFANSMTNRSFLGKLVMANAKKCLILILDKLGSQAKKVIIDHRLIYEAFNSQEPNMIKLLQKYEKDIIKIATLGDCDILYYATNSYNLDIFNFVLDHTNIDMNVRDESGLTCIYTFISSTFLWHLDTREMIPDVAYQIIRGLVDRGASVHNVTNMGTSLLHIAVISINSAMHLKMIEFIVDDLQLDVNTRNSYGATALHLIISRRGDQKIEIDDELTSKVVDLLVKLGASVHATDNNGASSLDMIKYYELHFLLPIVCI